MPIATWFDWDSRAAVVAGDQALVLSSARGWQSVNPADVTWDGRPLSEADARHAFADDFRTHGDPPLSEAG